MEEKKDFKEVKVKITGGAKEFQETLSRSMLYSGVNIFGQLSELYLKSKDDFMKATSQPTTATEQAEGSVEGAIGLSNNVLQIFKKLQKRDPVTKVKAFQELDVYLSELDAETDELENLLTFFLYHFCRILLNEEDKKVREAAHATFSVFIKRDKRKLGPHIKKIFPLWICSFFDPSSEAASQALQNFDTAFPKAKQSAVFLLTYKNFLHFANEQLKQSEDSSASADKQSETTFDRVTASVLNALSYSFRFTEDWPDHEQITYKKKMLSVLELDKPVSSTIEQPEEAQPDKGAKKAKPKPKQSQNYMWAFLTSKYRGTVRAAALQFVTTFLMKMPDETVKEHIPQLAPLVFSLVGEDNSFLQTTLWKEAIFTIGRNFADSCWQTIAIKKDFLPKLYKCLKEAAYGAQTSLYENFVKYVSICPMYNLASSPSDKLNKTSFKDRCNLIREVFVNLYAGLKNDEAVLFHEELVQSYFDSIAFVLLKRVQTLQNSDGTYVEGVTAADFEFCIKEVATKLIELPLNDYVQNYAKMRSKAQNERNTRVTIPRLLARFLVSLAERDFNPTLFARVCEVIQAGLPTELLNSSRVICAVLKQTAQVKPDYRRIVYSAILQKQQQVLIEVISKGVSEASKATIELLVGNTVAYSRVLLSLNKLCITANDLQTLCANKEAIQLKCGSLLAALQKKETMAKNMLKQEDLEKFQVIKKEFVNSAILQLMAGFDAAQNELDVIIASCLFQKNQDPTSLIASANQVMEATIFNPSSAFPKGKLNIDRYFERIQSSELLHTRIVSTVCEQMMAPESIHKYASLINHAVVATVHSQPSCLTLADVKRIRDLALKHISQRASDRSLTAYYETVQELIVMQGSDNNELRVSLFNLLLSQKYNTPSLWKIFAGAFTHKDESSQQYEDYCIETLKNNLGNLIKSANRDLQSVEDFSYLTTLIGQLTGLDNSRQIGLLQEIVLVPEHFQNLEQNPLPLKLFRDLFIEGANWDVSKLVGTKSGEYVWLFATFLNFKYLVSLSNYYELKKQLVIFVETEVMPALIAHAQEAEDRENSFAVQLCAELARHAGIGQQAPSMETALSYMHTLEFFVQKMRDPGEDFPEEFKPVLKVDEFKDIFNRVCAQTCGQMLTTNFEGQTSFALDIAIKILKQTAYYLLDEPLIVDLYKTAKSNLQSLFTQPGAKLPSMFKQQAQIYIALSRLIEVTGSDADFKIDLVNLLFEKINAAVEGINNDDVQDLVIELVDELLIDSGKKLQEKVEKLDLHLTILDMLVRTADLVSEAKASDCSVQIKLCNVIKKTIGWSESSTAIVSVYLQAVTERAQWFDSKREKMAQGQYVQGLQQFEYEMLQEMAETLLVLIGHINEDVLKARAEDNLYSLIGCGIEPLQKAAFVVLKFIYENFVLPVEFVTTEAQELEYLMEEAKKGDIMEESKDTEAQKKFKHAKAFNNVPKPLVDMIEEAPDVLAAHDEEEHKLITDPSNLLEQLVFGKSQEGCMSAKVFGYFLAWNAVLIKIEQGRIKSQISFAQDSQQKNNDYNTVLNALTEYIEEDSFIYEMLLVSLVGFFPPIKKGLNESYSAELAAFAPEYCAASSSSKQARNFCLYTLINFMKSFPSLARKFYTECDRKLHEIVLPYIKQVVSPAIMEHEIKKIELSQAELGANSDLTFVLFKSTKEIVATYVKTAEISVQIKLKIPSEYPLRTVQVDLGETLKLKQGQIRKWTLSIKNLIQQRNGDIISAILLWKSNIDKEMDGIEECYICYCVMHGVDRSLPNMQCQNCKNKFHVACIRKWFSSSNKSNCPLCQTYFFQ